MGLLDALTGRKEIRLSPKAGLLLACISMIAADGSIDDDEMAIVRRIDGKGATEDWENAVKFWKRVSDPHECVESVSEALSAEQRRCALANLIDIAMADGELEGAEKRLLEAYISSFGVDDDFVSNVAQTISVKNNHSIF